MTGTAITPEQLAARLCLLAGGDVPLDWIDGAAIPCGGDSCQRLYRPTPLLLGNQPDSRKAASDALWHMACTYYPSDSCWHICLRTGAPLCPHCTRVRRSCPRPLVLSLFSMRAPSAAGVLALARAAGADLPPA